MKYILLLLLLLTLSCKNQKKEVLLADREAPLGWIYLRCMMIKVLNLYLVD